MVTPTPPEPLDEVRMHGAGDANLDALEIAEAADGFIAEDDLSRIAPDRQEFEPVALTVDVAQRRQVRIDAAVQARNVKIETGEIDRRGLRILAGNLAQRHGRKHDRAKAGELQQLRPLDAELIPRRHFRGDMTARTLGELLAPERLLKVLELDGLAETAHHLEVNVGELLTRGRKSHQQKERE